MKEATRSNLDSCPVRIGLDWAKAEHEYRLITPQGECECGRIEQDDSKLRHWVDQLAGRFPGRRLRICMESGREALLWRLESHPHVDLFVVNPATAARYRRTFTPSGDKNDRRDAASLLDLFQRHPEKVRPHRKSSPAARALHQLSLARRHAVDRRTAVIASLREVLELYYPVARSSSRT